jgi:hypothetical protein
MRPTRNLFAFFAGLVSGTLIILMIARIKARNSRRKLMKTVDVFTEPVAERINEFFDIIAVTFDIVKVAVAGLLGFRKAKSEPAIKGSKTAPGRYVRAKN